MFFDCSCLSPICLLDYHATYGSNAIVFVYMVSYVIHNCQKLLGLEKDSPHLNPTPQFGGGKWQWIPAPRSGRGQVSRE